MSEAAEIIKFSCPLPPPELRSNSRKHWSVRVKAKREYSQAVYIAACQSLDRLTPWPSWEAAEVTYTWRYCGVQPDASNLGQNLKALQDFLCLAPNNGAQKNDCTYLGIVKDDKNIDPRFRMQRVAKRVRQGVDIVIERRR